MSACGQAEELGRPRFTLMSLREILPHILLCFFVPQSSVKVSALKTESKLGSARLPEPVCVPGTEPLVGLLLPYATRPRYCQQLGAQMCPLK